jgi:mRNA interferase RelE/StbE
MTWGLLITSPAERDLRHVPSDDLKRINATFDAMADDPYGGDTRMLRGTGGAFRRRVGDWRIIFELHADKHLIVVLGVKRRSSTTY